MEIDSIRKYNAGIGYSYKRKQNNNLPNKAKIETDKYDVSFRGDVSGLRNLLVNVEVVIGQMKGFVTTFAQNYTIHIDSKK